MCLPSGDQEPSVSMARWVVRRVVVRALMSRTKMSGLPSTPPSVTTSLRPSGENDGAPLIPGFDETLKRLPVRSVWTQTDDLSPSNET